MSSRRKYAEGTLAVSIPEAASMLGVCERIMAARVLDGTVRSFKLGKLRRIPRKEIERILEGNENDIHRVSG